MREGEQERGREKETDSERQPLYDFLLRTDSEVKMPLL